MKKKIIEKHVLDLPSFDKTFQIETNVSGTTIGVVLSQEQRPIAYFSKKMNEEKHKYSSYDKYFYAVFQALKKSRHYLMPKEFTLYTNNHALQFISSQHKLNQKHAKWVEFMQLNQVYASCENIVAHNRDQWLDYMLQEGMLFKNSKLCIP